MTTEESIAKAKQLEIELIVSVTNDLRRRFKKLDKTINKTEYPKPTQDEIASNPIGNVLYIMPHINIQYKESINESGLSMLNMLDKFRMWTSQLETLVLVNKHNLYKASVRKHLNEILSTCSIIDAVVKKSYEK